MRDNAAVTIGGFACIALAALAACRTEAISCAPLPKPGVVLTVLDAQTGSDLGQLAVVTVTSLTPSRQALTGPAERVGAFTSGPGRYELRTTAAGYAARTDTVTVQSRFVNGCEDTVTGALTVRLTAQR